MAYRQTVCSSSSDQSTDSDEDETYWKRRKTTTQPIKSLDQKKITKPRNRIWANVTNDQKLDHILSAANLNEKQDETDNVENCFIDLDSIGPDDQMIRASNKTEWDDKLFSKDPLGINWNRVVSRSHMSVNFTSSPDSVIEEITVLLQEPNHDLIAKVVQNLGVKRALEYYYLTEDVEQNGGMLLKDGSRRRSPGGVFLNLIKISPEVSRDEKKAIFLMDRQIKDKLKRRRRELRKRHTKAHRKQFDKEDSDPESVSSNAQEPAFQLDQNSISPNANYGNNVPENQFVNSCKHTKTHEEGELSSSSQEN